jgi:nucleotide sugar dehydrogenase
MTPSTTHAVARFTTSTAAASDALVVACVGMGYVGLPTSLALNAAGFGVIGFDVNPARLEAIAQGTVDALPRDLARLRASVKSKQLRLTAEPGMLAEADAVIIAVPTPVDEQLQPDPRAVHAACATVVEHARAGQTIILTSTTYVGTTRTQLVEPLAARGLVAGRNIHVAFAPERILPGDASVEQTETPRVLGGVTPDCTAAAARVLDPIVKHLHTVPTAETAEFTKLFENTFRALNLGFANEMAAMAKHFGIDPIDVVEAASTKPYGFLSHYPSAGVGGHCIPVDPYYLLAPLAEQGVATPIATAALNEVAARPARVADRALELLSEIGREGGRILIVGMAYKPGVSDYRESPAYDITRHLHAHEVDVDYFDPLVERCTVRGVGDLESVTSPNPADYALVLIATVHPGTDYTWLDEAEHVLDATYRALGGRNRHLV